MTKPEIGQDGARRALATELEARFADGAQSFAQLATFTKACLPTILAALRAEPVRAAEEMRTAIHSWIREDVPLAGKVNLMPKHVDALIVKLAPLPAQDEGRGDA